MPDRCGSNPNLRPENPSKRIDQLSNETHVLDAVSRSILAVRAMLFNLEFAAVADHIIVGVGPVQLPNAADSIHIVANRLRPVSRRFRILFALPRQAIQ